MVVGRAKNPNSCSTAAPDLGRGGFLYHRAESGRFFWWVNVDGKDFHRCARRCPMGWNWAVCSADVGTLLAG